MNHDNTNSGALFKNDKQGKETRPDYRGTLDVNGQQFWISAWLKSSKAGQKYMSLSVQPKEDRQAAPMNRQVAPPPPAFDDEIPF